MRIGQRLRLYGERDCLCEHGARSSGRSLAVKNCPISSDCLQKELNLPTPLEALLEVGGALWPEHHRYLADTLWTNSPPATVLATLRDHFTLAPSPKSQTTFVLSTGKDRDSSPLPDGAYSMTGDALMLCYAIWERPEDESLTAHGIAR